jgi:Flp pilus assembly protein TadD
MMQSAQCQSHGQVKAGSAGTQAGETPAAALTLPADSLSVRQLSAKVSSHALHDVDKALKLAARGEHAKALALLEHSVRDSPDFYMAHNWLGVEYNALHRVSEAVSEFEKMAELDPQCPVAFTNLAVIAYNSGRFGESERYARLAIKGGGDFSIAQFVLAMSLIAQNRELDQAKRLLLAASRNVPSAMSTLHLLEAHQ